MTKRLRFVCDVHLGRVAKYLRLLGFDTLYRDDIDDEEFLRRCRFGRIGLTCDRRLHERDPAAILWLRGGDPASWFRKMGEALPIRRYALPFRRTLCCNRPMVAVAKSEVFGRIPKETRRWLDAYWICPRCGKLYWMGTHAERMREKVLELLGLSEKCLEVGGKPSEEVVTPRGLEPL